MNNFNLLEKKYTYLLNFFDLTPDSHIAETIKELSNDISALKILISKNKDNKEVVSACEKLIIKVDDLVKYFESRLKNSSKPVDEEEEDGSL